MTLDTAIIGRVSFLCFQISEHANQIPESAGDDPDHKRHPQPEHTEAAGLHLASLSLAAREDAVRAVGAAGHDKGLAACRRLRCSGQRLAVRPR